MVKTRFYVIPWCRLPEIGDPYVTADVRRRKADDAANSMRELLTDCSASELVFRPGTPWSLTSRTTVTSATEVARERRTPLPNEPLSRLIAQLDNDKSTTNFPPKPECATSTNSFSFSNGNVFFTAFTPCFAANSTVSLCTAFVPKIVP